MMNLDMAYLVRQEQYNDYIREATHNAERTPTMLKPKNALLALVFALSFAVIFSQQPTHAQGLVKVNSVILSQSSQGHRLIILDPAPTPDGSIWSN